MVDNDVFFTLFERDARSKHFCIWLMSKIKNISSIFLRIPIYYLNCYVEIILIKLPFDLHIGHLFSNFSLQE